MLSWDPTLVVRLRSTGSGSRVRRVGGGRSSRGRSGSRLAGAGGATALLLLWEEGFEPGAVDEVDGAGEEGGEEGVEEEPDKGNRFISVWVLFWKKVVLLGG